MPRLIGKQSNTSAQFSLLLLATIGILTTLEYTGAINVVNDFGHRKLETRSYSERY